MIKTVPPIIIFFKSLGPSAENESAEILFPIFIRLYPLYSFICIIPFIHQALLPTLLFGAFFFNSFQNFGALISTLGPSSLFYLRFYVKFESIFCLFFQEGFFSFFFIYHVWLCLGIGHNLPLNSLATEKYWLFNRIRSCFFHFLRTNWVKLTDTQEMWDKRLPRTSRKTWSGNFL